MKLSQSITFKCPSCGAYLEYDPSRRQLTCPYCGASFDERQLAEQSQAREAAAEQKSSGAAVKGYHCQSCGAEVVVSDTTAATRCYYCHSPVVLGDRLDDAFRPDGVVAFRLDKQAAEKEFRRFIGRYRFVDRSFFSPEQLEDFSGVYYPYWIGDVSGEARFEGEGTRTSVMSGPRETVTTTRFFRVKREGRLSFAQMVRKGLTAVDRRLSDGVHPYRLEEMKPFASGYLTGFMAEKRDVEQADAQGDMEREAEQSAERMMKQGGGYDRLAGQTEFKADRVEMRYVLLPAWVLTYQARNGEKPYYYMMNGQTGHVCGRLPIDKKKLLLGCAALGLAVFGALCAGGAWLW